MGENGSQASLDTTSTGALEVPVLESGRTFGGQVGGEGVGGSVAGELGGGGGLGELGVDFLGVAEEEHVDHDGPGVGRAGDGALEAEDLTAEEPPDEADGVAGLVVAGDGDVDEGEVGVGVAEGDDGDVGVGGLLDGLGVRAGVGDDEHAGLFVLAGAVVRDRSGRVTTGDGGRTSVVGELSCMSVCWGDRKEQK